jgi:hypothetical protein
VSVAPPIRCAPPGAVVWHCANHRLVIEVVLDPSRDAVNGENSFCGRCQVCKRFPTRMRSAPSRSRRAETLQLACSRRRVNIRKIRIAARRSISRHMYADFFGLSANYRDVPHGFAAACVRWPSASAGMSPSGAIQSASIPRSPASARTSNISPQCSMSTESVRSRCQSASQFCSGLAH